MSGALSGRRVAVVLGSLDRGGAEHQALLLIEHLIGAAGACVEVLGFGPPGEVAARCAALGVPCHSTRFRWPCRWRSLLRDGGRVAAALRRMRPDVVLPYTDWANVACGLVWRATPARVCVWNQRNAWEMTGRPMERLALRASPWVLANAQHGADYLRSALGLNRPCRVIPNGVDLPPPRPEAVAAWRSRLGLGPADVAACMLAHFRPAKDHATLLRAWRVVCHARAADGRRAVLVLAGRDGGTRHAVEALIRELSLEGAVVLVGEVASPSDLLGAMRLGVLASTREGLPNAVLEYMAAGLPVAGADLPGLREALGPGADGALVPPGDASALANAMLQIINNKEMARTRGEANRVRARNVFGLERMRRAMTALLAEAVVA